MTAAVKQQLEDSKKAHGEAMKWRNSLQQKNRCPKLQLPCTCSQLKEACSKKESEFQYDNHVQDEKRLKYYTGFKTRKLLEAYWSMLEGDVNWKEKETTNEDQKFVLVTKMQLILVSMRLPLGFESAGFAFR